MNRVRCAIYTRKSSEEGLEQDFNSLDAQRDACSAYVLSQASEGWTALPDSYDDGGLSGGTLQRPGLQRLLADVAAGKVDVIVVYKVDRLTRSLLDFAKLVEAFDKAGTSFVSVTQSFNTTTSMGRLTLNMLLSFAQFEREVTAERIRDKIAASKARGMWMGGVPPLGYRPDGRTLAMVEEHAAIVRQIFSRYLELGTVPLLEAELKREKVTVPRRTSVGGKPMGGGAFSRGLLYQMLSRVVYVGQIAHGTKTYPGQHPAIIEPDLFARVQTRLAENTQGQDRQARATQPSLLAGKVVDGDERPFGSSHACKGKARYRYHVSGDGGGSGSTMRVPARELEKLVAGTVARLFDAPVQLIALAGLNVAARELVTLSERAAAAAARFRCLDREAVASVIEKVSVSGHGVDVRCGTSGIANLLRTTLQPDAPETVSVTTDARLTRTGRAVRLVQPTGGSAAPAPDTALKGQLVAARRWWAELRQGQLTISELAEREKVSPSYMTRIVRLAFLAPSVVDAVLTGTQRAGVDVGSLTLRGTVPACWAEQERMLLLRNASTAAST